MTIPEHCIDFFKQTFSIYPSFIETKKSLNEDIKKRIFSKSKNVWTNKIIDEDEKKITIEEYWMYDSNGIMIYIKYGESTVFLTTPELIKNVELLLTQLKKIKK